MKLIVGLGNPGNEYKNTRHNIGFMLFDYILGDVFKLNKSMNALEYIDEINGEKVIFIKPLSYMNLSGGVVKKYLQFYKFNINDIFVVQDDLDMNVGEYKILFNRGDGGHNGIKDIINNIGSKEFMRLKIGISKSSEIAVKDYVLGKINGDDLNKINVSFDELNAVFTDYIVMSKNDFVQKYNTRK